MQRVVRNPVVAVERVFLALDALLGGGVVVVGLGRRALRRSSR